MNKLKMHSKDWANENIAKIAELYPNCVTEVKGEADPDRDSKPSKAIDFDLLRQELSTAIVEGPRERYRLDWPGKRQALLTANAPIAKTLRPCREESVDFDSTENLFIEGDNLNALKLLQETYLGKVKMIYIDPPYNTGKDFIYKDKWTMDNGQWKIDNGDYDENGNRLIANTESNGRFHSDWLSMMYSRIKLARNLLKDDGVIYISIDDNEQANLKRICDEVFGNGNFIANYIWKARSGKDHTAKHVSINHESIICYTKNSDNLHLTQDIRVTNGGSYIDKHGKYSREQARQWGTNDRRIDRPTMFFPIIAPDGTKIYPIKKNGEEGCWRISQSRMNNLIKADKMDFLYDKENKKWNVYAKKYDGKETKTAFSSVIDGVCGTSSRGAKEIKDMFTEKVFDTVKPSDLIKYLIYLSNSKNNDLILDFFAGSSTTAHAVMQLNAEDGGKRRFIMVQLPEVCDEKSEALKAGYHTIAEISKERIRRAGKLIKEENALTAPELDIGFRVLKVDSSNMSDVYYAPDDVEQDQLDLLTDNIKDDRAFEDLLFQVLLDWGVDLTLPITKETIDGRVVFFVDDKALAACFEKDGKITEDFCKKLAGHKPLRVVFRDSGFANDSVKINVEQIFKLMSPHTDVKTI